jgi:ribosomal protein L40E
VESDRCPSCAARVPAGAAWCGQCWADLRPEPAPAPASAALDPLTAPLAAVAATVEPDAAQATSAAGAVAVATDERPRRAGRHRAPDAGWPCARCEAVNDVAADACRRCGAGFLDGAESKDVVVPGFGPASRIDKSQKVALVVGGTVLTTALLLALSLILGAIF